MIRKFLLAAIASIPFASAAHAGSNPFVGEIETFSFNFCPTGWLPTNGAIVSITQYVVLFQLVGTTYGGDGVTTFRLPHTRVLHTTGTPNLTQCIAYLGVFPSRG
jgi:hypothetical protein